MLQHTLRGSTESLTAAWLLLLASGADPSPERALMGRVVLAPGSVMADTGKPRDGRYPGPEVLLQGRTTPSTGQLASDGPAARLGPVAVRALMNR